MKRWCWMLVSVDIEVMSNRLTAPCSLCGYYSPSSRSLVCFCQISGVQRNPKGSCPPLLPPVYCPASDSPMVDSAVLWRVNSHSIASSLSVIEESSFVQKSLVQKSLNELADLQRQQVNCIPPQKVEACFVDGSWAMEYYTVVGLYMLS